MQKTRIFCRGPVAYPLESFNWGQIMRVSALLFMTVVLIGNLLIASPGHGQGNDTKTISLDYKNVSLLKVIKAIKEKSDVVIMYELTAKIKSEKIDISVKDKTVFQVLDELVKGRNLKWTKQENIILIEDASDITAQGVDLRSTPTNPRPVFGDETPQNEIEGKVVNNENEPLAGASIVIKRTGKGVQTDAAGKFKLKNVFPQDILTISFTGYKQKTISVAGETSFYIILDIAKDELDVAIVQAYGTTTRRLTTGNIAKVTASEIERQPVLNPLLALQGKVAGLDVKQTSGYASAPVKVELRGRSAINDMFTSDPLYIIDGVPLSIVDAGNSNYYKGSTGFLQTGNNFTGPARGQSPLFSLNPADLESIEVLKDADATSIYGSRGANGVILITTKKGKAGKTKFDMRIEQGQTRVTKSYDLLNTSEYLMMRREAFKNDGIEPDEFSGFDIVSWDTTRYTNWQKVLYGGTGKRTDVQGGLTGGNGQTNFRIGIGYNRTTGITTVSGGDQRSSLSLNIGHKSANQRFGISLTASYSMSQSDMIQLPHTTALPPNAPPIYDSIGGLNYIGWGGQYTDARNAFPFYTLKQPYTSKTGFLNSSLTLNYRLAKGLNVSASIGYNNAQANQENYYLIASQDPLNNPRGTANLGYNSNRNWIVEPQITYERFLGRGKISFLAGGTAQHAFTDGVFITGTGYTSDILIKSISSAQSQRSSDAYGEYRYAAIFGRVSYTWENKYLFNFTTRRDGSSRFGAGNQYGNFASAGIGWIFSEENLIKNNIQFLSFGKIRASYGTTGSDAVGDYQYLTRWSSNQTQAYSGLPALVATQHANPSYQWQINKKLEAALELGFLQDKIHISAVYYRNRCGNQLVGFPTPVYTGFSSVTANSPALVENNGWEFSASAALIKTKYFNWSINFNTAVNKNKFVSYPNFELSPYYGTLVVGRPLNIVKLLHFKGVDPQTGQYTFEDRNKDGEITFDYSNNDDSYEFNINPKFFGGIGMSFNYKNFGLNLFFNVRKQQGINAEAQGDMPGRIINQPAGVVSRWQKPGDVTQIARFTTLPNTNDGYFQYSSDGVYSDASFVRLSNLSLNYSLPEKVTRPAGIQGCSFFVHSNNLFIITKYKGIDPETQDFKGLPPVKTIVCGVSFNF